MKYTKNRFNQYVEIENKVLPWVCDVHSCCVFMDVCIVLFPFCLFTCVCVCLSLMSIGGAPSRKSLLGYFITVHHLCAFLIYLAR